MRSTRTLFLALALPMIACDGPAAAIDAAAADASNVDARAPEVDGGPLADAGPLPDTGPGIDGGPPVGRAIGEWTDSPGACPSGATRVDITTVAEMEDASRGDAHTEGTCFFVHDGVYTQRGSTLPLYFLRGGSASAPIVWVGESRTGVVIHGRATFEAGGIVLSNMTFDLTSYAQTGAFNTITVLADDVTISHVTLTGDCATGLRGGHIEVDGDAGGTLIEACIIERFGQCAGDGHLDHGIYLASGHDITIRNDVIRENSSRGIQLNTEDGAFGTLTTVTIERNRIYENGHRDYEDGIVMNGSGTGDITGVTIRENLFYRNYYAGVRFTGDVITGVVIEHNTFVDDGATTSAPGRSEINLDEGTPMATVSGNIFVPERTVVNVCDGALVVSDDVVLGDASGACVSGTIAADPMFVDAASDDFHTTSPVVAAYGAYAP
jgi:hypothetical protein